MQKSQTHFAFCITKGIHQLPIVIYNANKIPRERCVSEMPALEGGATRIVDWMDQNLHDLFIPTYYHLLLSSYCAARFFAYVLRNIKIDALFDVAYIKCKERKKDWRKNKAVFIFNLFCFVKGKKTFARPSCWNWSFLSHVHYQEFWFPSFCMQDCFFFVVVFE